MSRGAKPPPPPSGSTDRRRNTTSSAAAAGGQRRARSSSQPVVAPSHPVAGPSSSTGSNVRLTDIQDYNSFLNSFAPGPSSSSSTYSSHQQQQVPAHAAYDEEALTRAIQNLQTMASPQPSAAIHTQPQPQPPLQTSLPQMSQMPLGQIPGTSQLPNPALTEAFLAALPWLQYMQLQNQYGQPLQQQPQQQQQQQQHLPSYAPSLLPQQSSFNFGSGQFRAFEPSETPDQFMAPPEAPSPTHEASPEAADPSETDQSAMSEDKRRRNTAASARFRIKKKQWTLNLERTISDLSGRVEELEREAAELRRENGWLKEIVMLKSKRFSGVVPELGPPADSPSSSTLAGGEMSGADVGSLTVAAGEDDKSRESSRSRREKDASGNKGKGRQT